MQGKVSMQYLIEGERGGRVRTPLAAIMADPTANTLLLPTLSAIQLIDKASATSPKSVKERKSPTFGSEKPSAVR